MTYKEEVISCLTDYPVLFFNRLRVDEHLFAVIGNGYEWKNGQLVECEYDYEDEELSDDSIIVGISKTSTASFPNDEIKRRYEDYSYDKVLKPGRKSRLKFDAEHPELMAFIMGLNGKPNDYKHLPEDDYYVPVTGRDEFKVYPLCEYSKLCCIPDDVQRDWLDAIENFVDFCLSHQEVIRDEYNGQIEWLNKSKVRINEIRNTNNW